MRQNASAHCPIIVRQIKLPALAGKTNCSAVCHNVIVSISEHTFQDTGQFMKRVLLGELIVDQETVGPLWDEMIRYHIHKNLLMEHVVIHLTSLCSILVSSVLILSFNRYHSVLTIIL